jgi:enoyl-CoA hydratase
VSDEILVERSDGTALVTLNRPEARNALTSELLRTIPAVMAACDADDEVRVIVITGADPAFCAGLDLRELGSSSEQLTDIGGHGYRLWARTAKPVIGAVNGPAVTGGFELALQCDFLVASERATFGDTHARVGLLPGGGLSVLLPQAIGVRRAKEMSLTGNFLSADDALAWGLVNHVVPHDELLPLARKLAADIASYAPDASLALLDEYEETTSTTVAEALKVEGRRFADWRRRVTPEQIESRRAAIVERGRAQ